MTSLSKRRLEEEGDFILTLSDNDDDLPAEIPSGPGKASKKRKVDIPTKTKTSKKMIEVANSAESATNFDGEIKSATFGAEDEDDGAMNSEFEFESFSGDEKLGTFEEFKGWGFEAAKKGLKTNEKSTSISNSGPVEIDEIIARRKEKKDSEKKTEHVEEKVSSQNYTVTSDSQDNEGEQGIGLEEEDDEFLAEDGFGMGINSDDEEAVIQEEFCSDDEGSAEDSEENREASPAPHPDDLDSEDLEDDFERHEDPGELARREAFFAPEEKPAEGMKVSNFKTFQAMSLSRPILRGLASVGFTHPTPIQAKTIPVALLGKDVVGGAVTGSGKTAAFIVPILERLLYRPRKVPTSRVAILMPTRELAIQCHAVAMKLASHTDIKFCLAVGGLSLKAQENELRLRPDVIIGTPGRFIDHMRNSVSFTVDTLEILVLDEADRMLEAGFADELNEIVTTIPKSRQTMLFSATMTSSIDNLIRVGLNRPVRILVDAQKQTVDTLTQEFIRLRPGREAKRMGYLLYLCKNIYPSRVIIFFRQKREAHRARVIFGLSDLKAAELHGGMSQEKRILNVEAFRDGKVAFLLATDLASRGLDIKGVETVINYEVPQSHEIYLHRVGRTARAGRQGRACTLAAEQDRKIVKAAVKSGRLHGAKIVSRVIEADAADKWHKIVSDWEEEIEAILNEEKEEKQLAQLDMQVRKGENIITHENEIMARPKRTWFESEKEKKAAQQAGKVELNGPVATGNLEKSKRIRQIIGGTSKLSNKKKKMLDDRDARVEGKVWKKGRAEREGKGTIAASQKKFDKKKKPGARPQKKGLKR
ncbi:ATP-dependent RNA helicase drs1 [Golovinomyces cichoracearum]|uniref:RNA helicase n=1 Tax=Golovinomyces cichoracearum TaxID=62708 RepID=A0A420J9I6_9PEZI|nr:ATP-dependent RNA helicase drs1 [Golovinomyces cichoracearum]